MKRKNTDKVLLEQYQDPENPCSFERLAKDNRISIKRARQILERDLGYTLKVVEQPK